MFHLFAVVCKFGITKGEGLPDRALDIIHSLRGILGFMRCPLRNRDARYGFFSTDTDN